jgi:diadenosine tetraphosphate (Ap4A) HIT family hydrolase
LVSNKPCPFCHPNPKDVFHTGTRLIGLWDRFPVAPGHALLVPKRHVATWFDATAKERSELLAAIDIARDEILTRHQPDGFNIGINIGEAAGQTIFHLHLHVIPRYRGDVEDPTGGVRHIIPSKAITSCRRTPSGETSICSWKTLGDDPGF